MIMPNNITSTSWLLKADGAYDGHIMTVKSDRSVGSVWGEKSYDCLLSPFWLFGWAYPEEPDCVCTERMLFVHEHWTGGWLCVGWWFTGDSEEVCCWCKLWARHWHSCCVFCYACKTNIKKVRFKFVLSLSLQLTCTLWCIYSSSICFTHVEAWPVKATYRESASAVEQMIKEERWVTLSEVVNTLWVGVAILDRIIREYLNMSAVNAHCMPRMLTSDMMEDWVRCLEENLELL